MEQQWVVQYNNLKTDVQDKRKVGLPVPANLISSYKEALTILEKNLKVLMESPMEYEISTSEISRRQVITENLKKHINFLSSSESKIERNSFNKVNGSETSNPLTLSDRGLIQRQMEVIQAQDAMLGQIEKGVDRLHSQALEIGHEAKIHVKILEDLDRHVDIATDGLRQETKHAEQVRKSSNVCYMYICIGIEAIALVVLIILTFVAK